MTGDPPMSAAKNGIKTTLRTPGKALLFTSILLLLSILLSTAFSVYAAVRSYLKDCNDYFHTIITLDYLGKDYPARTVYDPAMREAVLENSAALEALCTTPQVLCFEAASNAAASVEGLHRNDRLSYDPDAAVLRLYVMGFDEATSSYSAIIEQTLYAREDHTGKMVELRTEDMDDPGAAGLESRNTYLTCGHFFQGQSSYLWYLAEALTPPEGDKLPAYIPWSREDTSGQQPFVRLAAYLDSVNNCCPVQYTAALDDQLAFHQQLLTLEDGRLFLPEEYAQNARVCVISARLASLLALSCGDTLTLGIRQTNEDLYGVSAETVPDPEAYTVVGIYARNDDYPYTIFLPSKDASKASVLPVNGYRLGQFRVQNDGLTDFLKLAEPLEALGFRFTVYDQGYAEAIEPMQDLLLISDVFLLVCISMTFAAMCLQCHLFITRQREAAQTMRMLGSGRTHVICYYLTASTLLALPAAVLGCMVGHRLERAVFRLLGRLTSAHSSQDLRFSSSRLSLIRTLAFSPKISAWVYVAAGVFFLLSSLLLTLLFSLSALRDRAKKRQRRKAHVPAPREGRSSHLRGRLKYALLSMRRSYVRTAAVLLFSLFIALFFGYLTDSLQSYRAELAALREHTVLSGHATDAAGQRLDGIVVSAREANAFLETDLLSSHNLTNTICNIRFLGVSRTADGEAVDLPAPHLPNSAFAIETLCGQMLYEPLWVQTSSIAGSPLFYYTKPTTLRWLTGYGEASMTEAAWDCVMPQAMMDRNGIRLGDTCRFLFAAYDFGSAVIDTVDLKVIGAYSAATDSTTIFSPIGFSHLRTDKAFRGYVDLQDGSYDSMLFTLGSTSDLPALRAALADAGFNYAGSGQRTGTCAVIDDEIYLNTTTSMERQIRYVSTLYVCLYVIAGILGLTLSWLLTASRKKELALMRALGTQPGRIAANFHAEQMVLCGTGLLLGMLLWRLIGGAIQRTQVLLTGAFFLIWSVTALLCVLTGLRRQAYIELTEPE